MKTNRPNISFLRIVAVRLIIKKKLETNEIVFFGIPNLVKFEHGGLVAQPVRARDS